MISWAKDQKLNCKQEESAMHVFSKHMECKAQFKGTH